MTSTVQPTPFSSRSRTIPEPSVLLHTSFLSSQVSHLLKVIAAKDATLEEIRRYVNHLINDKERHIESFSIVQKTLEEAARETGGEKVRRSLSYEISEEIDENIADAMERIHEEFNAIFERHKAAIDRLGKEFQRFGKDKEMIEYGYKSAQFGPVLVQVPVEMSILKETATQATQVDLFQSPKNSERNQQQGQSYQLRLQEVEEHPSLTIKQVPIQLPQVYEVPVDLILPQDHSLQLHQLKAQLTNLHSQNSTLKKQIQSHNDHPYYFQIEITTPDIAVPFDNTVDQIELPLQFVITNDGHSQTHFQVVEQQEEEGARAGLSKQEEEWSPKVDAATRSEIQSNGEEVVGIRTRLRQVKEESIMLENAHDHHQQKPILIQPEDPTPKLNTSQPIKYIQIFVQKIIEVPVQLIIQRIKYIEVPIVKVQQVQVYKLWPVEVERIVEIPVEVVVEREKIVEFQTVIREINQVVIKETHQVTIEKSRIYEVPVEVEMVRQQQQQQLQSKEEKEEEQQEHDEEKQEEEHEAVGKVEGNPQASQHRDFEAQQVQLFFDNEFNDHQLVIQIPQEMMVQRTVEKTVYLDRIVEVPVQVFVQRIVQVPVQVIRIVQVPVQVSAQPKIMYVYVPYIVEVPLQLNVAQSVIQVPVQMQMQPIIYEIPVDVTSTVEVVQIPVDMQEPPLIYEVPVEMNMISDGGEVPARLENKPEGVVKVEGGNEEVFIIPMNMVDEITIEHNNRNSMSRSRREIVVEIPVEVIRLAETNEASMQTQPTTPNLIEIPIQLDISQQTRRNMQLRYHQKVSDLNCRYQEQIKSLLEVVENLQRIIVESTHQRQHLAEELEGKALLQEQLNKQLIQAEIAANQASEERDRLHTQLTEQNRRNRELLQDLNQMVSSPPIVYQLPVELTIHPDTTHQHTQTTDLLLPQPSIIQVPVQCQVLQRLSESQLRSSDKPFKYFKGYTEQEVQQKLREFAVKPQMMDRGAQTQLKDTIDLTQFDLKTQILRADNPDMVDYTQYMRPDLDQSTQKEVNLISGIQCAQDYEHFIDEIKIYEYALEIIPEPIIYEVPVDLKLFKESRVSQVQTEDARCEGDGEDRVRLAQRRRTEEVWIQTEEREDYMESYSAFAVSRIIQIPIELTIEFNKDAVSIDIQTQEYIQEHKTLKIEPPTSQDFRQVANLSSKLQISRFDIVQLIPLRPSEVIRLPSVSYSLADQFANQSLTIDNIPTMPLAETQKQYDIDSKFLSDSHDLRQALVIITSHHNKDRQEVIVEENEAERSRVQVHIDQMNELNFQEVQDLQGGNRSQIKQNYSEMYENAAGEVEKYRAMLEEEREANVRAYHELEILRNQHQERVRELEEELHKLQRRLEAQQLTIEEQRASIQQSSQIRSKLQQKIQHLIQQYQKAKEYNTSLEESSTKELERLKTIINQKIYEIKELKSEQYQTKELYQNEIQQLRAKIIHKKTVINQLEDQNQRKANKIQQLYDYQEELRKNIAYMKHNSQSSAVALYQQEFIRIKDDFQDTRKRLEEKLKMANEENQQLREQITHEQTKNQQLTEEANELDHSLAKLQQQYLELKNLKAELQCSYLQGVKQLQSQLQELKDLLREKDNIIQQLQPQPLKLNASNPEDTPPRMQYLSRKISRESSSQHLTYIKKLETLLVRYQKMLANNQVTIQELQEKVCEYLRDALEKQHESELLYSKLVEYQATMNNILVQKITLQIQNKRMGKSLELSQRKILILGNKLLQAAGKRQVHESSDEDYYYQ